MDKVKAPTEATRLSRTFRDRGEFLDMARQAFADLCLKAAPLDPLIEQTNPEYVSIWGGKMTVKYEVEKFSDMIPILEAYENLLNVEITDSTEINGYARSFKVTDWLDVDAAPKENSKHCRRVVVGYEEARPIPIYKFVCDDEKVAAEK